MSFETLHQLELPLNRWLYSLGNEWSDAFFRFANVFDRFEPYALVMVLLWIFGRRQASVRLFYIFAANSVVNSVLKAYFALPRPLHLEPELGLLYFSSYGMPSGGATTAALIATLTFLFTKSRAWRSLSIAYGLVIVVSRLCLGAHFASDVVVGLGVGVVEAWVYYAFFRPYEHSWPSMSFSQRFSLLLLPVVLFSLASIVRPLLLVLVVPSILLIPIILRFSKNPAYSAVPAGDHKQ
jgi:membrane-associated phospholipid phosphatase